MATFCKGTNAEYALDSKLSKSINKCSAMSYDLAISFKLLACTYAVFST